MPTGAPAARHRPAAAAGGAHTPSPTCGRVRTDQKPTPGRWSEPVAALHCSRPCTRAGPAEEQPSLSLPSEGNKGRLWLQDNAASRSPALPLPSANFAVCDQRQFSGKPALPSGIRVPLRSGCPRGGQPSPDTAPWGSCSDLSLPQKLGRRPEGKSLTCGTARR